MHRKALGRGLEALIPGAPPPAGMVAAVGIPIDERAHGVQEVSLDEIRPNPFQPRTRFADEGLQELAASIKATGVLQPIIVRPHVSGGYELVAGERRMRAARLASLDRVPAIVRGVDDREMLELALIENIQREDLNPIDEARAYQTLISKVGLTHDDLSQRVGKQRSTITNSLRLLGLTDDVQEMVSRGTLSAGHARALLGLEAAAEQVTIARYVAAKALSVRRTEALITRRLRRLHTRPRLAKANGLNEMQERLQQKFATRVVIKPGRRGGNVSFEYYGQTDLERLLEAWGVL